MQELAFSETPWKDAESETLETSKQEIGLI